MITRALRRFALEAGDDGRAALGEAGDDLAFGSQRLVVGAGGGDRDGAAAEEAVAVGQSVGGKAKGRDRHDVGAVQREQPVRRTDEPHASCRRRAGRSSPWGSAARRSPRRRSRRAPRRAVPRAASGSRTASRPCPPPRVPARGSPPRRGRAWRAFSAAPASARRRRRSRRSRAAVSRAAPCPANARGPAADRRRAGAALRTRSAEDRRRRNRVRRGPRRRRRRRPRPGASTPSAAVPR